MLNHLKCGISTVQGVGQERKRVRLPDSDLQLFWGTLPDDELSNQTMNSFELNGCLGVGAYLLDKPLRPSRLLFFVPNRRYFLC